MQLLKKITDFIMPPVEEEVEEIVESGNQQASQAGRNEEVAGRRVANGGTISYGGASYQATEEQRPAYERMTYEPAQDSAKAARSQFKVHTTKPQEMRVQVYVPSAFDQVAVMADDLKDKKAVIVNYEKVDLAEQRRICDFLNGVCYVLDGDARRISQNIVLYVPEGIDVSDAMSAAFAE